MANTTAVQSGTQQLVRVFDGVIGGQAAPVCDGRELHVFLQNGKQFSDWIKQRISQYGFEENQDFHSFSLKSEKPHGGRPSAEYHLSLDMAKELSMVENNEQGRAARRYFIAMERQVHAVGMAKPAVEMGGVSLIRRAFRGFNVNFALLNGKPWVCAANICTALGIGSSDRITRSLPEQQKRLIRRGSRVLWLVDASAAMRSADYCRTTESAEVFRTWLPTVLAELQGVAPTPLENCLSQLDMAALYSLCAASDQLQEAHERMRPVMETLKPAALLGVPARLETCRLVSQHLRSRFGPAMLHAAKTSGLADDYQSPAVQAVRLEQQLAAAPVPMQGELLPATDQLSPVERFGLSQLLDCRLMCGFDSEGKLTVKSVAPEAVVLRPERVASWISARDGLPREYLPDALAAVAERLKTVH